jgi:hypothetical protein
VRYRLLSWWAEAYDHHVVSRLLRHRPHDGWLVESAVNLGAWFDVWAERAERAER